MKKIARGAHVIFSTILIGFLFFSLRSEKTKLGGLEKTKNNLESNNTMLATWLFKYIKNEDAFGYFEKNSIKSIAIYGLGTIGILLFDSLSRCRAAEIKYIIDKSVIGSYKGTEIISIEKIKQQEQVDAIIVTPHFAFNSIENDLKPHTEAKIISLLEVLVS